MSFCTQLDSIGVSRTGAGGTIGAIEVSLPFPSTHKPHPSCRLEFEAPPEPVFAAHMNRSWAGRPRSRGKGRKSEAQEMGILPARNLVGRPAMRIQSRPVR